MANTFLQALSDTIHRAVNLRVVTILGDAGISGTLEEQLVTSPAAGSPSLVTDINIVAGDITTIVSPALHGPDYEDLRTSHEAAVKQAREIVERNVSLLVTLFKEMKDHVQDLPAPQGGPVRTSPTQAAPGAGTA